MAARPTGRNQPVDAHHITVLDEVITGSRPDTAATC
jgi:hypothetical protein